MMKKHITIILVLCLFVGLTGCTPAIKTYTGKKLTKLSFSKIEYMGGNTREYILVFESNVYSVVDTTISNDYVPITEVKKTFSEEEEAVFIDTVYSYGLFNIKKNYTNSHIDDGAGWILVIEYEDKTSKISQGSNSSPKKIFERCSAAFYDLCGERVL